MSLVANRPLARLGSTEQVLLPILSAGVAANTNIYAGAIVGLDASGYLVNADSGTAVIVCGTARKQFNNLSTNAPYGAAGAIVGEYVQGASPFAMGTSSDALTVANRFQDVYLIDNQTVGATSNNGARLRAGYLVDVQNGQAIVMIGVANPTARSDDGSTTSGATVQRVTTDIPLATIQAQTSGTAFNVGSVLPANARLLGAELNVLATVTGGSLSAVVATLQGGSDAAGTILASKSVFAATGTFALPGSNPYQARGGQQIKITLTATGDTLANATTGHLSVDLFYAVLA